MDKFTKVSIAFVVALCLGSQARAQIDQQTKSTGSISGRVTISGKPARGIRVVVLTGARHQTKKVAVARTDADGRYYLSGIPPGNCTVTVDAPTFASLIDEDDSIAGSKNIKLEDDENVEHIDLEISPGAVITGRVTEADGRPVIDQTVQIIPFKEGRDNDYLYTLNDPRRVSTDDRGVYRAYGLPAGRYRVKVGDSSSGRSSISRLTGILFGHVPLPEYYHPGVPESSKAAVVEVAAGEEATEIDIRITLSSATKTKSYTVAGRVVDAQTGKPLPGVDVHYQREMHDSDDDREELISDFVKSDSKGDFRIYELPSGTYKIHVQASDKSPWLTEEVAFEIGSSDLRGLELRAKPAGSISGIVVLENPSDPAIVAKISQLKIGEGLMPYSGVNVNKDGSFSITGLEPGAHPLSFIWESNSVGFEIVRLERDGVQLDKSEQILREVKVGPGENVTGVRVIIAHYTGVVRGQIKIEGGALPQGGYLNISATPVNQPKKDTSWTRSRRVAVSMSRWRNGIIDSRRRFIIDRLPPGEYEINLDAYLTPWKPNDQSTDDDGPLTVTRTVTVSDSGETQVDFTLDLSKPPPRTRL